MEIASPATMPKPKAPRKVPLRLAAPKEIDPPEAQHQEKIFQLVEFWREKHPDLGALFAIPNGGYRAKATAVALKRQGVRAGVPDMFLPVPRGNYHGLWLELKRFREGAVGDDQAPWLTYLESQGYRALVVWGWRAAWEELCEYLEIPLGWAGRSSTSRHKNGYLQRKETTL